MPILIEAACYTAVTSGRRDCAIHVHSQQLGHPFEEGGRNVLHVNQVTESQIVRHHALAKQNPDCEHGLPEPISMNFLDLGAARFITGGMILYSPQIVADADQIRKECAKQVIRCPDTRFRRLNFRTSS